MTMSESNFEELDKADYHAKLVDCYIYSRAQSGIIAMGHSGGAGETDPYMVFQMEGCTLVVDQHDTDLPTHYVNGYALNSRGLGPGSYVRNNVFLSGDQYNGGRGVEIRENNTVPDASEYFPSYTDTIPWHGNYFDMHNGRDAEFASNVSTSMCVKIRRGNHYTHFYDNVLVQTIDTHIVAGAGYTPQGLCLVLQVEMDYSDDSRAPYHITIENNLCSLKVVTHVDSFAPSTYGYCAAAFAVNSNSMLSERDTTIKIRNNYLYSEGNAVFAVTNWDANGERFMLEGDTFHLCPDSGANEGTHNFGHYVGVEDVWFRDITYLDAAHPESACHRQAYNMQTILYANRDWNYYNQRTLQLYVQGNNDLPVVNAVCSVWNSFGALAFSGVSGNGGNVSGVTPYYYYSVNNADTKR